MSLFEVVLGIGIMGMVLAYALAINTRSESQATGRNDADALSGFQNLAAQYFIGNRAALEAALKDGTGASSLCRLGLAADGSGGTPAYSASQKTCAFDATLLRARSLWPAGLPVDARGGRYVAILRLVYDTQAVPQPTGGTDMLVVLAQPGGQLAPVVPDGHRVDELTAAMSALGGVGGYVPAGDMGACKAERASATYQACGNGWKVNLADFIDPGPLAVFANALPR